MDEQTREIVGARFSITVPLDVYKMLVNIADRKKITVEAAAAEILKRWSKWALST